MKQEIKFEAQPPARAGYVHLCMYCGDDSGTGKFCPKCKTKKGREEVLKENLEVLKQLRKKGFCLNEVLLPKP